MAKRDEKKNTFKSMDVAALRQEVEAMRKELFNLQLTHSAGQLKDHGQLRMVRRNIARGMTLLNEKTKQDRV